MTSSETGIQTFGEIYGIPERHLGYFTLGWRDSEHGEEGRLKRNRLARTLRKRGYEVEVKTVSFADLARDSSYLLTAYKPGAERNPMGPPTYYQDPA